MVGKKKERNEEMKVGRKEGGWENRKEEGKLWLVIIGLLQETLALFFN